MNFNFNEYIGDIMNDIGEATSETTNLIGQEQLAHIHSLKVEIESLKNQLKEKEEHISLLERSHINRNIADEVEDAINSIIQEQISLLEAKNNLRNFKKTYSIDKNLERIKRLHEIEKMSDVREKLVSLFEFVSDLKKDDLKSRQKSENEIYSIRNRLLRCLQGHVEFLTRLAESPELQSLFLVSSNSGETFLSETTKNLLAEQAARTSAFIFTERKRNKNHNSSGEDTDSPFSIRQLLDIEQFPNFDVQNRNSKLKILLDNNSADINNDELKELLIQEVSISSILRRYCESLNQKNSEYKKGFDSILQIFNKRLSPSTSIRKVVKEIEHELNAMKEELHKKDEILQNASRSQNKAIEKNESTIRSLKEAVNSSEAKSRKLESKLREIENQFNQSLEENQKLKSKVHQLQKSQNQAQLQIEENEKLKSKIYQLQESQNQAQLQIEDKNKQMKLLQSQIHSQRKKMDLAMAQNENSSNIRSLKQWDQWSQRLYYALTGIMPDNLDDESIRMAIEESALTAVGNPKVQSFLSQQKKSKNGKNKW
ncbi:hypothetical protein M9Y10_021265 [Tritrichomonas musculus]|uniref:GRIP domain-containing protein n=1 Tax=Tritrichomonas musculus TaxID=1915356 RepID=A0ABR2HFG8_9EUKA